MSWWPSRCCRYITGSTWHPSMPIWDNDWGDIPTRRVRGSSYCRRWRVPPCASTWCASSSSVSCSNRRACLSPWPRSYWCSWYGCTPAREASRRWYGRTPCRRSASLRPYSLLYIRWPPTWDWAWSRWWAPSIVTRCHASSSGTTGRRSKTSGNSSLAASSSYW